MAEYFEGMNFSLSRWVGSIRSSRREGYLKGKYFLYIPSPTEYYYGRISEIIGLDYHLWGFLTKKHKAYVCELGIPRFDTPNGAGELLEELKRILNNGIYFTPEMISGLRDQAERERLGLNV